MNKNALRDITWVRTTEGSLTVEEALLRAHEIDGLDLTFPALEVSATYRLLCQIFALVGREMKEENVYRYGESLFPEAVAMALDKIGTAAYLNDPEQPFMQRPPLEPRGPKDSSRKIGPGDQPVKKLLPFMPPDQAENFWSLSVQTESVFDAARATLALVVFHHFSMAGNNKYDDDKCAMGAPGIRFPGQDNTATEIIWQGENLLQTLRLNTPLDWVKGRGLPAWADRTAEYSRDSDTGELSPLWMASWSSNAAVGYWEDNQLTGVRTGGVPKAWHPFVGADKDTLKQWWDIRNIGDPFYLYIPDRKTGELKAQRLDLQRDLIDLAIEWNAAGKSVALNNCRPPMVLRGESPDDVIFFRHQVGGTASSPAIRASEILKGNSNIWAPDEVAVDDVREFSEMIRQLHFAVTSRFRRKRASDGSGNRAPAILEGLEARQGDASAYFWREIADAFDHYMNHVVEDPDLQERDVTLIKEAALRAFDLAAAPFESRYRQELPYVRADVQRKINYIIDTPQERSEDNE